jgi:acyl transferase domain-containing protein
LKYKNDRIIEPGTVTSTYALVGFGGTNSHAIIKQIKPSESKAENNNLPYLIVALSATKPEALENTCHHFLKKLKPIHTTLKSFMIA